MGIEFSNVFDECFTRIKKGGAVRDCLAQYPHMRKQLEPLLHIAASISAAPKVVPSDKFRKMSRDRLIARLREECTRANDAKSGARMAKLNALVLHWQRLMSAVTNPKKAAIAVAAALLIALGGGIYAAALPGASSPSSASAPDCALTIVTGTVEIQTAGSTIWQEGIDGMTLEDGTRVKTAPQSMAVLAFFEGSAIELEANTEVEIEQVEQVEQVKEAYTLILLKQWLGRTWSRVVELTHPSSRYEIQTPSACAMVRGTSFLTAVDDVGSTQVQVAEGLVIVAAQGEEASVPAGYEVGVQSGSAPSEPTSIGPPGQGPEGQGPPGWSEGGPPGQGPESQGPPGQGPEGQGPPGWSEGGPPGQGPEGQGPPGCGDGRLPIQGQGGGQ